MDIAAILVSQHLASLEMIRQTIIACPEEMWNAPEHKNRFWQTAYHAVYFSHEYLWANEPEKFVFWHKHQPGYDDFNPVRELEPYDKETVLEYLAFCREAVVERVPRMDLAALEVGVPDEPFTMLELQIYTIRHLMQHAGELLERLSGRTAEEIDWVARLPGH